MGYLDRAKALMKEAGSEAKAGIYGTKSVISVKTYPETKERQKELTSNGR